jgi:hypothetical protein
MGREKNRIPLVNKNQSYEKKKSFQERTRDRKKTKETANFKETVKWDRLKMRQPSYLFKRSHRLPTTRNNHLL